MPYVSDEPLNALEQRHQTQIEASQAIGSYLLNVMDDVCARSGIRFYLDAGTLLGAVRNRGWIPWDDDVDLVMLRPEYQRLRKVTAGEWPSNVALSDPALTAGHVSMVPRLQFLDSKVETTERAGVRLPERQRLALDIFIADRGPASASGTRVWLAATRALQMFEASRGTNLTRLKTSDLSRLERSAMIVARSLTRIIPRKVGVTAYELLATAFANSRGSNYYCLTHMSHQRGTPLAQDWFASEMVEFEGVPYFAPRVSAYLTGHYGPDFMAPPPAAARTPHPVASMTAKFRGRTWRLSP